MSNPEVIEFYYVCLKVSDDVRDVPTLNQIQIGQNSYETFELLKSNPSGSTTVAILIFEPICEHRLRCTFVTVHREAECVMPSLSKASKFPSMSL